MQLDDFNGVWAITFTGNNLTFNGVLAMEESRAMGGDNSYIYTGNYWIEGDVFHGQVQIKKYNPFLKTMMPDQYTVSLSGAFEKNELVLIGAPDANKDIEIQARLVRQADLPGRRD